MIVNISDFEIVERFNTQDLNVFLFVLVGGLWHAKQIYRIKRLPAGAEFVEVRCASSGTWASCQNDESNTAIEREIVSSFWQHSKNSSNVITPSQFKSIFWTNRGGRRKRKKTKTKIE